MNYKSFNLGDWIGHISGAIEDERELDGNEMRDLVEFLTELPKWIPVSERLPNIHNYFQEYLITNKNKLVCKAFFTNTNGKQWWSVDDVIAWMPLPQPYKAESEES